MKHLRRFNESLKDQLQDFCETYLAYLIDDGFKVSIMDYNGYDDSSELKCLYQKILIGKIDSTDFEWFGVKDYILPFLYFLFKDYDLVESITRNMGIVYEDGELRGVLKFKKITLEEIDNIPDKNISSFFIYVKKK